MSLVTISTVSFGEKRAQVMSRRTKSVNVNSRSQATEVHSTDITSTQKVEEQQVEEETLTCEIEVTEVDEQ